MADIGPTSCAGCGKSGAESQCAGCHQVRYCNRECQTGHWKAHKAVCKRLKKAAGAGVVVVLDAPAADDAVFPAQGAPVAVHYTGSLANGSVFDSSLKSGNPFRFTLGAGMVIRGWDDGIGQIPVGCKGTLYVSSDYGYGAGGYPPDIPGGSALIFTVEVLAE